MSNFLLLVAAMWCFLLSPLGFAQSVNVAGFAFNGQFAEAKDRYPYSFAAIEKYRVDNASGPNALSRRVVERARSAKNNNISLSFGALNNLKNSDQALVVALVLTGETTLVERFSSYSKIFVNLRAEALLFDFKAQTVIRSYPINLVLFDARPTDPKPEDIEALVGRLLFADEESSLISQFTKKLELITVPGPGTKTVQVRKAEVREELLAFYPEALRKGSAASNMMAESFSSFLSSKTNVPLIPSKISHATGVMRIRFEDMYEYELKLPESDYVFDITLKRLVKVQHSKNNVGTAYIFGAFADIQFSEPYLNSVFFSSELKNGETAVVPAGKESSDDFPAYQDAIRGLFSKFSVAVQKQDMKWMRTASNMPNHAEQIRKTKDILESCK